MRRGTILVVAFLAALAACEKPNLESTGGGYEAADAVPDTPPAVPDTATGAE